MPFKDILTHAFTNNILVFCEKVFIFIACFGSYFIANMDQLPE